MNIEKLYVNLMTMIQTITVSISNMLSAIYVTATRALEALASIASGVAASLNKNIIQPCWNGITQLATWTKDAFISVASAINQYLLKPLGNGIKLLATAIYDYLLTPIGKGIKFLAKHITLRNILLFAKNTALLLFSPLISLLFVATTPSLVPAYLTYLAQGIIPFIIMMMRKKAAQPNSTGPFPAATNPWSRKEMAVAGLLVYGALFYAGVRINPKISDLQSIAKPTV